MDCGNRCVVYTILPSGMIPAVSTEDFLVDLRLLIPLGPIGICTSSSASNLVSTFCVLFRTAHLLQVASLSP